MWVQRKNKKNDFKQAITTLKNQVLIVRGARQVGKTSFIINTLKELKQYPQIKINLASSKKTTIDEVEYFGRDFFGKTEDASQLLHNISLTLGDINKLSLPAIVFIDESDRYPISLETIQIMAGYSSKLKVIYTGSNLENILTKNAATGRKRYFDLYPITFQDFLKAYSKENELKYLNQISIRDKIYSEMYHNELLNLFELYIRLGGMPKILDTFIDIQNRVQPLEQIISDLVNSIEENVKAVLGEKALLYEYEDVLRKLALSSTETLKFSKLQVQHIKRNEAKKLVNKTVGARVAHKIRLFEAEKDLSKYLIFDAGVLNYLLNGSDLLRNKIVTKNMAIQYENAIGNEIITTLPTRDDIFYWKSKRGAQVEFILNAPKFMAIDVKTTRGDTKSLDSCAIYEHELEYIIKISKDMPILNKKHIAKITNLNLSRQIPLLIIPHYLSSRTKELI